MEMALVVLGFTALQLFLSILPAVYMKPIPPLRSSRYNVVMVMSDAFDGRLTLGPENNLVSLPNLNLMKRHGAVFLNAYTNSPICCPSRAAMWSGLYPHLTESWNNHKCLDPDYPTWMDHVKAKGYVTQKLGKQDYRSGSHSLSNRVEAWTRDVPFLLRQEGRPLANLTANKTQVCIMQEDWKNADLATSWLRQQARNSSQPFFLYLGLNLPHPYPTECMGENFGSSTFLTSPYWLQRVSYKNVTIPVWLPLKSMHPVDYYSSYTKNCTGHFTDQEILNIRAYYYAMCAEADGIMGEIISALTDTGLLNSTYVLFTSDHGELAMEHRQFYKMSMYEGSSHIPLLIMGPNIKPGQRISNIVSLVDLYPTMLEIAGVSIPQNISGFSLMPLLSPVSENDIFPGSDMHPNWALSQFHGSDANASTYMLRENDWKYIAYADGDSVPPQLFDLSVDPDELRNVAVLFPDTARSMDKKLRSIIDYKDVSASVHRYNKEQFISWRASLGRNYTNVISNLRWHVDWNKRPKAYSLAIDRWLESANNDIPITRILSAT
ncbi:arylsulfatase K isoform X1 [Pseudophryne corroboree]|uniref:arylsulfatase K isoform X1 n=1 Tax=Pseudophryne corroboree TaxID=495146 RepID=UPI003081E6DF